MPLRILTLRSEIAKPLLTNGLARIGHAVSSVAAYRTVGVPVDPAIVRDVAAGRVGATVVTSGSVAAQVREQFGDVPAATVIACIGPRTAKDARAAGLHVDVVSERSSVRRLIEAVANASSFRASGGAHIERRPDSR